MLDSISPTLLIIEQTAEIRGSLKTACSSAWFVVSPSLSNSGIRAGTSPAHRIVFIATRPIPALWQAETALSNGSPGVKNGVYLSMIASTNPPSAAEFRHSSRVPSWQEKPTILAFPELFSFSQTFLKASLFGQLTASGP